MQADLDFTWRLETIATFLAAGASASTQSALTKIDVYNETEDEWDTLKFRLMLWPAAQAEEARAAAYVEEAEEAKKAERLEEERVKNAESRGEEGKEAKGGPAENAGRVGIVQTLA